MKTLAEVQAAFEQQASIQNSLIVVDRNWLRDAEDAGSPRAEHIAQMLQNESRLADMFDVLGVLVGVQMWRKEVARMRAA